MFRFIHPESVVCIFILSDDSFSTFRAKCLPIQGDPKKGVRKYHRAIIDALKSSHVPIINGLNECLVLANASDEPVALMQNIRVTRQDLIALAPEFDFNTV